jgi:hypothetical protein
MMEQKKIKDFNLRGEDNEIYSADPVNGYTPSWFTINFRSQLQVSRYCTIQIAIENIADKFYRNFLRVYLHQAEISCSL